MWESWKKSSENLIFESFYSVFFCVFSSTSIQLQTDNSVLKHSSMLPQNKSRLIFGRWTDNWHWTLCRSLFLPSKHLCFPRRPQDVFAIRLPQTSSRLQNVFFKSPWRGLQNIFMKSSCSYVLKTSWKTINVALKTSSSRHFRPKLVHWNESVYCATINIALKIQFNESLGSFLWPTIAELWRFL